MQFKKLYHYKAVVIGVYDGDTITVNIDLGLNTWINNEKIRLSRINAPELKGKSRKRGLKSKEYLKTIVGGKEILLQTIKDRKEKYGRYLGEIWLEKSDGKFENVNDLMVKNNFAEYKEY